MRYSPKSGRAFGAEQPSTVDWEKHFPDRLPSRAAVDPDRRLQGKELGRQLEQYLASRSQEGRAGNVWLLTEEWTDLLDPEVRQVCLALNRLSFVRTRAACGGHKIIREIGIGAEPSSKSVQFGEYRGQYGYQEPYLRLLMDWQSPESPWLLQQIRYIIRQIRRGRENFSVSVLHWGKTQPQEVEVRVHVTVPESWCQAEGKPTTAELTGQTARQGIQPGTKDFDQLFARTYADYYDSAIVREIIHEFFAQIETKITQ